MAASMHAILSRAFKSERLVYRAPESPKDDAFLFRMNSDSDADISACIELARPPTMKRGQDWIPWLNEKTLIGVIICLDPAHEAALAAAKKGGDAPETTLVTATTPQTAAAAAPADGGASAAAATAATATTPKEPTPIGVIFLRDPYNGQLHHRQGELGLGIDAAYQRQGYGAEAMRWILDWGFQMAGLHRIRLNVYDWNAKAMSVYRRVGFRTEATERESIWCAGRWWDNHWMAILEYEWRDQWRNVKDTR